MPVIFKMADKISMSQRALPKVTSPRYISSQRYISVPRKESLPCSPSSMVKLTDEWISFRTERNDSAVSTLGIRLNMSGDPEMQWSLGNKDVQKTN